MNHSQASVHAEMLRPTLLLLMQDETAADSMFRVLFWSKGQPQGNTSEAVVRNSHDFCRVRWTLLSRQLMQN